MVRLFLPELVSVRCERIALCLVIGVNAAASGVDERSLFLAGGFQVLDNFGQRRCTACVQIGVRICLPRFGKELFPLAGVMQSSLHPMQQTGDQPDQNGCTDRNRGGNPGLHAGSHRAPESSGGGWVGDEKRRAGGRTSPSVTGSLIRNGVRTSRSDCLWSISGIVHLVVV